jgi:hypothetical protein
MLKLRFAQKNFQASKILKERRKAIERSENRKRALARFYNK